ncbi:MULTISPECIES: hypothetical protein [unclassified Brevundimonas]|uniref:hypothetical protein n=1 Tax=unclassified Brevundimonas TaxID=2622653 RepID=UPI000CFD4F37|nr:MULTISPECIES: hypothetical protein [unclassified Brevundimonas]PRA25881.1 hypothetical protein CQ024_13830 [Brevundimonas sp. MYb27]PQZ75443.1 hypothetical protein CQ026_14680 [Brevundimonas sp. MYb31]PRB11331.1 hypothetical protein CQ039_15525 [Brevundimonas sp. MYb52]PRB32567.1 hypothetical protein CQ035_15540 [Brevundimonas sp. MYb46]PRB41351.1 hypothetical protein CQ028_15540 [Brevundimonas sp. MYb33]
MTDGVRPVGPLEGPTVQERREGDRRERDRRAAKAEAEAEKARALVPAGERVDHAASPAKPAVSPLAPPALFAAQVLGQKGQKRGLKGGPPVLDAARSTYLGAEYSGQRDRRPRVGKAKQTEI